jgi:glycosyltransferase involved in cell wall biosynthesis
MRMIPSFIDTRAFPVIATEQRAAVRAELELPADAYVIGCVGDIGPRKSQIDLVRALAQVIKAEPTAKLLLVGGQFTDYFEELQRVAAQLGVTSSIVCTGSRNDVPALLAAMDVFVLASRKESSPLAVLEALSRGLPVIATNVGMLRDFIAEDRTGHIVQVGDVDAIARLLIALAADPDRRRAMGDAAQTAVRAHYDMAIVAPQVEHELGEAAKIRNRPLLGFVAHSLGS